MDEMLLENEEENAKVHHWSEVNQRKCGDSLGAGHETETSEYAHVSVKQNNVQELREILDHFDYKTKQLFRESYGDIAYLLFVKVDGSFLKALIQF
ncbi:hypothetical protein HRI_004357800 [Hibiscus trionum]|uniref:Uncharacterized protein n=1 Tax=Hibiscus trionum TaxID=183268 RepID=A0A9W7J2X5_HIBTR|nr:hypothetical protein HRI_004357800 [Hibiscus trionum]